MTAQSFRLALTDSGLAESQPVLKDYLTEGPTGKYLYRRQASRIATTSTS